MEMGLLLELVIILLRNGDDDGDDGGNWARESAAIAKAKLLLCYLFPFLFGIFGNFILYI